MTEKPTYDASGSSSLQSDPTATVAPAHPLANLSGTGAVPFSGVYSEGDLQSEGEGLSGQPAFSSVLTVMAGTVRHPVGLAQSRTSPTITRDETHTTQWPSHSSSHGSEMSSSALSGAGRIPPASSGLTTSMSRQHTTQPQAVSRPSHALFVGAKTSVSSSPSLSPLTSSVSESALSTSSALSSVGSLFSLPAGTLPILAPEKKTLSPGEFLNWTDSLTATQSSSPLIVDLTVVTEGIRSASDKLHFPSEISTEKRNKVTNSPMDKIHGVSGIYIKNANTNEIKPPATSTYSSYSTTTFKTASEHGQNLLKTFYRPTQTQNPGMNLVSSDNLEISTSFPTNQQETQAFQRQQAALQNPTSGLPSAFPKGSSFSSQVTQQMANESEYADSQTLVHKSAGEAMMSPVNSHVVNPTASPAVKFRTTRLFFSPPGKMSFSETAITGQTPPLSGTVSSEHVSTPGDLLMAAGHSSLRVPAINMNYSQREAAESALIYILSTTHTQKNNMLSLAQPRMESTTSSSLSSITEADITPSTLQSDSYHLLSNEAANVRESPTQTGSTKDQIHEPTGWLMPKTILSPNSRTMALSESALPVSLAKNIRFVSHSPQHNSDINSGPNSEINTADQINASFPPQIVLSQRSLPTRSLPQFYKTADLTVTISTSWHTDSNMGKISAHITRSEGTDQTIPLTFKGTTTADYRETSADSHVHVTYEKKPAENFPEKNLASPLFDVSKESTLIRDTASNEKGIPSGQFRTRSPSFMTTKDFFVGNIVSEGSGRGSSSITPFSSIPFDAMLETPSRKDDVTLTGHREPSSPSFWSEIFRTQRINTTSPSQGLITTMRSDESNFYFGARTTIPSTASPFTTTSTSDGQKSSATFGAIFSFGTKIMAPHTKWKAAQPVSFKNILSELENTLNGFDRAYFNSQADGLSYTHPVLEGGQEHNAHIFNSSDPTVVASDPYSLHSTVGERPSSPYIKGASEGNEHSLNLSQANRSAVSVSVQQETTVAPSSQGSAGSLSLSHLTTNSVTSSQASFPALVYESNRANPLADADSLDKTALNFSDTDNVNITTDSKPRGLTPQTEPVPLSASFYPSLSFSEISSHIRVKPLQLSTVHLKTTTAVPPETSSASLSSSSALHSGTTVSVRQTMYSAGTASPLLSAQVVPAIFSSPLPSLNLSKDIEEVTKTSVVLTDMGSDDLTARTSKAVALTSPKVDSLPPSQPVRITLSAGPTERTSQVSPLPPRQDTTTASVKLTTTTLASTTSTENPTTTTSSLRTTHSTASTAATTLQPTPFTRRTTTTTTIRTHTSRRIFTPPVPRTSSPRGATAVFISPFTTTTTEAPLQQCNITERLWVKTGKQSFCYILEKRKM